MAKRSTNATPAKYQLSDLRISKVSLVDKPAVPSSVFVVAKRADDAEPVEVKLDETPVPESGTTTLPANPQIEALCKSVDALCEQITKLLEAQVPVVKPVTPRENIEEKQAKPAPAKSDRFKPYAKALNGLAKRVEKTETTIRNVTGELPPDEE